MQKSIFRIFILLIVLGAHGSLLSQDQDFLQAKVLDEKTNEPIIFATIRLLGEAKGVITNMDGGFRLPLSYLETIDSIEVSSMGYEKKRFELKSLSSKDINILYLKPGVVSLSEAVVSAKKKRGLSAEKIVRKAIENIPNNYPQRDFAAIGYYRDYQKRGNEYINLNESILEVLDQGFDTRDMEHTKVRIYDYRPNTSFEQDEESRSAYDYINYKKIINNAYLNSYGGNEFTILRLHDAVRNYKINSYDFVNVLERDFIANHYFKKEDDVRQDNELFFVISFRQSVQKNWVRGKLYISKMDFSIHKMEYTIYDRFRKLENGQLNKDGNNRVAVLEVITEYKRKAGRMYPNYLAFYNDFEVVKRSEFMLQNVVVDQFKRCFVLKFNDAVDVATAQRRRNYDITFEGKKIAVDRILVFDDVVEVYANGNDARFKTMFDKINAPQFNKSDFSKALVVEVKRISNAALTAEVNSEITYKGYKQYREFFVQEVKPNGSVLADSLFMNKNSPIFKDQPMVKPDNFDDYWMNTPLQNIDE